MTATIVTALMEHAIRRPAHRALVLPYDPGGPVELTFGQLDQQAREVASLLQADLYPGDRVVLVYEPGAEFVCAFVGCLYAGIIPAAVFPPVPPRVGPGLEALARVVEDSRAAAVVCSSAMRSMLDHPEAQAMRPLTAIPWIVADSRHTGDAETFSPRSLRPVHTAFLQYTSGSTSAPRGVMVTHAGLVANLEELDTFMPVRPGGCMASWLPMYHDMGLIAGVFNPLYQGQATAIITPFQFLRRPVLWLELITGQRATVSGAPNFAYELCARRATPDDLATLDLSSWEVAYCGAEPIRAHTIRRFVETFAPCGLPARTFLGCYGLAEATLIVSGATPDVPRTLTVDRIALEKGRADIVTEDRSDVGDTIEVATVGNPRGGTSLRIVDPDTGHPLPDRHVGEVWVGGPSVAAGYWNRPEETATTFGASTDGGDGPYLRTGDLGFLHDGNLYIAGRRKDVLIVRGRNIHPHDVEAVAEGSHDGCRPGGGAAVTLPDDRIALLQETRLTDADELARQAEVIRAAVLADIGLLLDEVHLVAPRSVLKTTSGKVRRAATRDALLAGELTVLHRSEGSR